VIDYETFCKIHDCRDRQRLTITHRPPGRWDLTEDGRRVDGAFTLRAAA
jgi:hypothetical protein